MDMISMLLILAGVTFAVGNPLYLRLNFRALVVDWGRQNNYDVLDVDVQSYPRGGRGYRRPGVARVRLVRRLVDDEAEGTLEWEAGLFGLTNVRWTADRLVSAERASQEANTYFPEAKVPVEDVEMAVINEVNRRLDGITEKPNWMEPYDLDGSGHIDDEEWSILRGKVMEEVRAELGAPGVSVVSSPTTEVTTKVEDEDGESW